MPNINQRGIGITEVICINHATSGPKPLRYIRLGYNGSSLYMQFISDSERELGCLRRKEKLSNTT